MNEKKIKRELKKRYRYSKNIFYILLALVIILILIDLALFFVFKAVKRENTIKVNVEGISTEEGQNLEEYLNQK
ncbi:hypothetical protein J7K05_02180 [bacterium]|nr:hypothetical protein [bacterium]